MDGTNKMKEFAAGTIKILMEKGTSSHCAAMLVASWIRYIKGVDEQGEVIRIEDPFVE